MTVEAIERESNCYLPGHFAPDFPESSPFENRERAKMGFDIRIS